MSIKDRLSLPHYCAGLLALTLIASVRPAHATTVDVPLTSLGVMDDNVTHYSADLGSIGLAHINSITLTDSNSATGGSGGQYSGFDLDAVFLEDSALNHINPTNISFLAGAIRGGGAGPTFGATSTTSIDEAVATLSVFDANDGTTSGSISSGPTVYTTYGFLSLGDGGIVTLYFDPAVAVTSDLKLVLGEVNTSVGESVTVRVAETPLPAAFWLCLSSLLCLFIFGWQSRQWAKEPLP